MERGPGADDYERPLGTSGGARSSPARSPDGGASREENNSAWEAAARVFEARRAAATSAADAGLAWPPHQGPVPVLGRLCDGFSSGRMLLWRLEDLAGGEICRLEEQLSAACSAAVSAETVAAAKSQLRSALAAAAKAEKKRDAARETAWAFEEQWDQAATRAHTALQDLQTSLGRVTQVSVERDEARVSARKAFVDRDDANETARKAAEVSDSAHAAALKTAQERDAAVAALEEGRRQLAEDRKQVEANRRTLEGIAKKQEDNAKALEKRHKEWVEASAAMKESAKKVAEQETAVLERETVVALREAAIKERESAATARGAAARQAVAVYEPPSDAAAKIASLERELKEAKEFVEDNGHLSTQSARMGWDAYWTIQGALRDLRLQLPPLQPEASWHTVASLGPAFADLVPAVEGARSSVNEALEIEGREVGLACAIDVLVLVKSRLPDVDVSKLVEDGPDLNRVSVVEEECAAAAEQIVSARLAERAPVTPSEDFDDDSDDDDE